MTASVTLAAMEQRLGQDFCVERVNAVPLEAEITLRLTEAVPVGTGPNSSTGFSLVFEGPETPTLEQGTWRLTSDDSFDMFLVPIGPAETEQLRYEAVFAQPPPDDGVHSND